MEIRDQVAIVTGAASGLGRAAAAALRAAGAEVAMLDRDAVAVAAAAAELGGRPFALDVADAAAAEALLPEIAALGPVRALVSCAGVAPAGRIVGRDGPMPLAAFEQAVRVSPFDPAVRCGLADGYAALSDPRAARERAACNRVRP